MGHGHAEGARLLHGSDDPRRDAAGLLTFVRILGEDREDGA
jgi:hypothetical protein